MNERKQLLYAILICALVALAASAFAIYLLYTTALDSAADQLLATVRSQARLIEAMARHDARRDGHGARPGELPPATLDRILDALGRYEGIGHTGEFLIARLEGDDMVYLAMQRSERGARQHPRIVPFHGTAAAPMRHALSGGSGTLVARDFRGEEVMAAYEAVPGWNLGIVAKMDLAEVRAPFLRAGAVIGVLATATVLLCALLVLRATRPVIRRLRESEARIKTVVDAIADSIITIDDKGTVESFSAGAERMFGYASAEVIGRNVSLLMPEPYHSEHDAYLRNYAHTGKPRVIGRGCQASARRKDGSVFPMELIVNEMRLDGERKFVGIIHDTTERKRTEDVLRENERRLATLMGNLSGMVYRCKNDPDWTMEFVSQGCLDLTGYPREEFTEQRINFAQLIHPDDREPVWEQVQTALRENRRYRLVYRIRTKDGVEEWVWEQGGGVYADSGELLALEGFITDITERVLAEAALRDSEQRFHTLARVAPVGIFRTDAKGDCLYVNERWCEIAGLTPEEAHGSGWARAIHPEDRDRIFRRWYECARNDIPFHEECRMQRPDGAVTWVLAQAMAERDARGRVLGYVGSVTDVTARVRAEKEAGRFGRILDQSMNEIYVFDAETLRFSLVNEGARRNLGYAMEELAELTPLDLKPEYTRETFEALIAPLRRGELDVQIFETVHRRKDGSRYPVEVRLQFSRAEAPPVFLAVILDISERRRAEAQRRKLSRALEQTADAIMITDRNGVIEYVNPAFESITGYPREEVLGRKPRMIKSDKQGADFYRKLWQTILAGDVFSEVFVNRRKDGTLYYEEKTITPLKDERGGITHFVATGKDISERMQTQERLQFMAQHDVLTELPNRALFLDRLKQSLARARWHQRLVAVLFLDLDRFKNINDTLGHQTGDQLLQAIGQRLDGSVREGDTVARLGGDEFAVLLDDVASDKDITFIAQKILDSLKPAFVIEGRELFVSASIGISLYPGDGEDSTTLLRNADIAMYRAKDLGRNMHQFYSAEMSARAFERLTLESSLRHALEREEFLLYYQPQMDARTGGIVGVEALLRWQHPDIGLVSPVDFIPILEESGLIIPVGEWVLQKACEQARAWQRNGHPALRLAVNLSARQFNEAGLVTMAERILKALDYDPALLELEITESVIMRHSQTTIDAFEAFNRMSVQLAVDDFGTGYSSLSYLRRFPIDTLKIDRSFIRDIPGDPDDTAITSAIIMMAQSLKLRAIAEGVETAEQHDFLRARGCDIMQGFFFSKPLPAGEMTRLLAAPRKG